jgi:3-hydroxyanthranilate 3,4-dioxygenase
LTSAKGETVPIPHLKNFNLQEWINSNRQEWAQGPGRLKLIWEDSDYLAFVSSEPTTELQFHVNPGDEIFYQLEGKLDLHHITSDGDREISVMHPGDILLLPANRPHSPRREDPDWSWTLVVTRKRSPGEMDRWVWFCENCNNKLYETIFASTGPGAVAAKARDGAKEDLRANEKLRACSKCGELLPTP